MKAQKPPIGITSDKVRLASYFWVAELAFPTNVLSARLFITHGIMGNGDRSFQATTSGFETSRRFGYFAPRDPQEGVLTISGIVGDAPRKM